MTNKTRQIFSELLCLTSILISLVVFPLILLRQNILTDTVDISFYDTYFIVEGTTLLFPLFLVVVFFVYFTKEYLKSFRRSLPNWILLVAGGTLIITITLLIKELAQFSTGSWTIYPPLSALPDHPSESMQDPATRGITTVLTIIQCLILTMTLFAVYRWAQQKSRSIHTPEAGKLNRFNI